MASSTTYGFLETGEVATRSREDRIPLLPLDADNHFAHSLEWQVASRVGAGQKLQPVSKGFSSQERIPLVLPVHEVAWPGYYRFARPSASAAAVTISWNVLADVAPLRDSVTGKILRQRMACVLELCETSSGQDLVDNVVQLAFPASIIPGGVTIFASPSAFNLVVPLISGDVHVITLPSPYVFREVSVASDPSALSLSVLSLMTTVANANRLPAEVELLSPTCPSPAAVSADDADDGGQSAGILAALLARRTAASSLRKGAHPSLDMQHSIYPGALRRVIAAALALPANTPPHTLRHTVDLLARMRVVPVSPTLVATFSTCSAGSSGEAHSASTTHAGASASGSGPFAAPGTVALHYLNVVAALSFSSFHPFVPEPNSASEPVSNNTYLGERPGSRSAVAGLLKSVWSLVGGSAGDSVEDANSNSKGGGSKADSNSHTVLAILPLSAGADRGSVDSAICHFEAFCRAVIRTQRQSHQASGGSGELSQAQAGDAISLAASPLLSSRTRKIYTPNSNPSSPQLDVVSPDSTASLALTASSEDPDFIITLCSDSCLRVWQVTSQSVVLKHPIRTGVPVPTSSTSHMVVAGALRVESSGFVTVYSALAHGTTPCFESLAVSSLAAMLPTMSNISNVAPDLVVEAKDVSQSASSSPACLIPLSLAIQAASHTVGCNFKISSSSQIRKESMHNPDAVFDDGSILIATIGSACDSIPRLRQAIGAAASRIYLRDFALVRGKMWTLWATSAHGVEADLADSVTSRSDDPPAEEGTRALVVSMEDVRREGIPSRYDIATRLDDVVAVGKACASGVLIQSIEMGQVSGGLLVAKHVNNRTGYVQFGIAFPSAIASEVLALASRPSGVVVPRPLWVPCMTRQQQKLRDFYKAVEVVSAPSYAAQEELFLAELTTPGRYSMVAISETLIAHRAMLGLDSLLFHSSPGFQVTTEIAELAATALAQARAGYNKTAYASDLVQQPVQFVCRYTQATLGARLVENAGEAATLTTTQALEGMPKAGVSAWDATDGGSSAATLGQMLDLTNTTTSPVWNDYITDTNLLRRLILETMVKYVEYTFSRLGMIPGTNPGSQQRSTLLRSIDNDVDAEVLALGGDGKAPTAIAAAAATCFWQSFFFTASRYELEALRSGAQYLGFLPALPATSLHQSEAPGSPRLLVQRSRAQPTGSRASVLTATDNALTSALASEAAESAVPLLRRQYGLSRPQPLDPLEQYAALISPAVESTPAESYADASEGASDYIALDSFESASSAILSALPQQYLSDTLVAYSKPQLLSALRDILSALRSLAYTSGSTFAQDPDRIGGRSEPLAFSQDVPLLTPAQLLKETEAWVSTRFTEGTLSVHFGAVMGAHADTNLTVAALEALVVLLDPRTVPLWGTLSGGIPAPGSVPFGAVLSMLRQARHICATRLAVLRAAYVFTVALHFNWQLSEASTTPSTILTSKILPKLDALLRGYRLLDWLLSAAFLKKPSINAIRQTPEVAEAVISMLEGGPLSSLLLAADHYNALDMKSLEQALQPDAPDSTVRAKSTALRKPVSLAQLHRAQNMSQKPPVGEIEDSLVSILLFLTTAISLGKSNGPGDRDSVERLPSASTLISTLAPFSTLEYSSPESETSADSPFVYAIPATILRITEILCAAQQHQHVLSFLRLAGVWSGKEGVSSMFEQELSIIATTSTYAGAISVAAGASLLALGLGQQALRVFVQVARTQLASVLAIPTHSSLRLNSPTNVKLGESALLLVQTFVQVASSLSAAGFLKEAASLVATLAQTVQQAQTDFIAAAQARSAGDISQESSVFEAALDAVCAAAFKHALRIQDYDRAFMCLRELKDPELGRAHVFMLAEAMAERGFTRKLLSFTWSPAHAAELEKVLWNKATLSPLPSFDVPTADTVTGESASRVNYYKVLYAFFIRSADYGKAAQYAYHLALRLENQVGPSDIPGLLALRNALAACLSALSLCPNPSDRVILHQELAPVGDENQPMSAAAPDTRIVARTRIVTEAHIARHTALCSAQLQLASISQQYRQQPQQAYSPEISQLLESLPSLLVPLHSFANEAEVSEMLRNVALALMQFGLFDSAASLISTFLPVPLVGNPAVVANAGMETCGYSPQTRGYDLINDGAVACYEIQDVVPMPKPHIKSPFESSPAVTSADLKAIFRVFTRHCLILSYQSTLMAPSQLYSGVDVASETQRNPLYRRDAPVVVPVDVPSPGFTAAEIQHSGKLMLKPEQHALAAAAKCAHEALKAMTSRNYNLIDMVPTWSWRGSSNAEQAWAQLRQLLDALEIPGRGDELALSVAQEILAFDKRNGLPVWLIERFKVQPLRHPLALTRALPLLRLMLNAGLLAECVNLFVEIVESNITNNGLDLPTAFVGEILTAVANANERASKIGHVEAKRNIEALFASLQSTLTKALGE